MYMGLVVPMWAGKTLRDPVAVVSATEIRIGFNFKQFIQDDSICITVLPLCQDHPILPKLLTDL